MVGRKYYASGERTPLGALNEKACHHIQTTFMFDSGVFTKGYVFHGDPERVFKEFFGGDNPFLGKTNFIFYFIYFLLIWF